ncbi:hypothetical protein [Propionivibrio sp.]|uniref:hypothetical protein n=1 Tax=Propionivibrio sp. TaxID=2212460 RepID=UPI0026143656|nr:hypothetical protein [Propionivibrio sp.]
MKRGARINWAMIFVAPVVGVGILVGLWLAVAAGRENILLAQAMDQILGIVDVARDQATPSGASGAAATRNLMERLAKLSVMRVGPADKDGQRSMSNPWGESLKVFVTPERQTVRIETRIKPHTCRRLLQFYGNDPAALGVQDFAVRDGDLSVPALWLPFYGTTPPKPLDATAIARGCGQDVWVFLALTFGLRH